MSQVTRLALYGAAMRMYGSFANRTLPEPVVYDDTEEWSRVTAGGTSAWRAQSGGNSAWTRVTDGQR